jgi:DnaJ-class molecular chaperone
VEPIISSMSSPDSGPILNASGLYEVLCVAKDASADAIRKSFKQLALKWHPDKCDHPDAKDVFQKVSEAYSVLSDLEKRKRYDTTGTLDDEFDFEDFMSFMAGEGAVDLGLPEELMMLLFGDAGMFFLVIDGRVMACLISLCFCACGGCEQRLWRR